MTKQDIENEIKNVMDEFKEARQCPISSWLDNLSMKLEKLHELSMLYE